jgi:hypothetical protein
MSSMFSKGAKITKPLTVVRAIVSAIQLTDFRIKYFDPISARRQKPFANFDWGPSSRDRRAEVGVNGTSI